MKNFVISVVMSVYNVEEWIREAVDSVINQTLDFRENIQIVFVDDGSTDGSGEICEEYRRQYPENIIVIHKENEGLARARLTGVKAATGKYVNFFDPDDILSPNVMFKVTRFFEAYEDTVDVVSIPMKFFGDRTGNHPLNYKFKGGTRVIDLFENWSCVQMSLASAFVDRRALSDFDADAELKTAEDTKEIIKILVRKNKLGVISGCVYEYRKRGNSSVGGAQSDPAWYKKYLDHFSKWALDYAKEKFGYIPKYIQYTVLYDLQWKFKLQQPVPGVLTPEEEAEFQREIFSLVKYFDDKVITSQKYLYIEHKLLLLRVKYGTLPSIWHGTDGNGLYLYYPDSCFLYDLKKASFLISIVEISGNQLVIKGCINSFHKDQLVQKIYAVTENKGTFSGEWYKPTVTCSLNEPVLYKQFFKFDIDLDRNVDVYQMNFRLEYPFGAITVSQIRYSNLSAVQNTETGFYLKDGWRIAGHKDGMIVERVSALRSIRTETARTMRLLRKGNAMGREAAFMRCLAGFLRIFKRDQLWLISDRKDRASDNGEALFRYLQKKKPKGIKACYVLQKSSPDYERMKNIGKVLDFDTLNYKLKFLLADKVISSSADAHVMDPFDPKDLNYHDLIRNKPFIFLQHGVTKDDISGWLNLFSKNIKGFITAANPEYQSILEGTYFYTEKEVWLTGFARFDRLYRNSQKKITFMPTWRRYLFGNQLDENNYYDLKSGFKESAFFTFYNSLFNNRKLIDAAEKYGYKLQLFIHPNMMKTLDNFDFPKGFTVLHKDTEYRDVYAESDLVLTDYSSAVFDFAYLRQPIIYMQFDADEFFKGDHVYKKGYFDYERDGFGEVEYDVESTVDRIIEYMENGCQLKPKYKERIDKFFAFNDQNNCERITKKISEMD